MPAGGKQKYAIGLHYGHRKIRCLLVDTRGGNELAAAAWGYPHGTDDVLSASDSTSARRHPADFVHGTRTVLRRVLSQARRQLGRSAADRVIAIGVAALGSMPLPIDEDGRPLAFQERFAEESAAFAWLWEDEAAAAEADRITALALRLRPEYLATCGGSYSSECFFSKILHCLRKNRAVFDAAYAWIEAADWIPSVLTGTQPPSQLAVGMSAAGHKAMFSHRWGGYPDRDFLSRVAPELGALRDRLPARALTVGRAVGRLSEAWAEKTGLHAGIPLAVGALDTHLCALGAGVEPGTVVKIKDGPRCSLVTVTPLGRELGDLGGTWQVVPRSILPRHYGLAAPHAAVSDVSDWYVDYLGQERGGQHSWADLVTAAWRLRPGESGLLALCWPKGLRVMQTESRQASLLIGQSHLTRPEEIWRALLEAAAFDLVGSLRQLELNGIRVRRIVSCSESEEDRRFALRICADAAGLPLRSLPFSRTAARGAAIAAAVAAGTKAGGHGGLRAAQKAMCAPHGATIEPEASARSTYDELHRLHSRLAAAYGTADWGNRWRRTVASLDKMRQKAKRSR